MKKTREHKAAAKIKITKKFGTANWLTISRLLLMIPFIVIMCVVFALITKNGSFFGYLVENGKINFYGSENKVALSALYWINIVIFVAAMITDWADGFIARKTKTVTAFGKVFDPIADKIATNLMLMFLAIYNFTYLPIVILFIVRDILVDGCRVFATKKNIEIKANWWGKIKTIIVTLAIVVIAVSAPWLSKVFIETPTDQSPRYENYLIYVNIPLILGLVIAWVSGIIYMKKYLKGITEDLEEKHKKLIAENKAIEESKNQAKTNKNDDSEVVKSKELEIIKTNELELEKEEQLTPDSENKVLENNSSSVNLNESIFEENPDFFD
ncbi:CDP-diacylglycerol--glycerol-3-phosphate 3-phosphatidyltransferase [[Mycoplasma] anseris]|uniref:CDP-diacylglycerol--glycerol-3-phosphate 3-phosphatidyltransferase n=1 Tax=[Mycoplasma] anseris TaxID=92400 RepID=A0A2Z4NCC4_9BACT|nr:CDP-diacylglycerol--glycerol-3-phosphate 3-phosphatidyltransferase [[Mycoplasma] anseris]AWX69208.1 CDP-diacylglycerol--glycerol-3-phosphate 3-phosphatidyltransferase [[Mycoplasma] anseris]